MARIKGDKDIDRSTEYIGRKRRVAAIGAELEVQSGHDGAAVVLLMPVR